MTFLQFSTFPDIYSLLKLFTKSHLFCISEFGRWSKWSDCDVTCGNGHKNKKRICSTGNPDDCKGNSIMSVECTRPKCLATGIEGVMIDLNNFL